MRKSLIVAAACALSGALLLIFAYGIGATEAPILAGRVNDYAGVLSPSQKSTLEAQLRTIETGANGPQVVVLFPKSLNGEAVEDYAGNVFRSWRLGQRGKDNGILLVIAPTERKLRLEVGYGLEGAIPDARSAMILSGMKPKLAKGKEDWFGAASAAATEIGNLIRSDR